MIRMFKECIFLNKDIKAINEKISELKEISKSPKNQVITGMPRSGGNGSTAVDRYLIKLENLERNRALKQQQLDNLWDTIMAIFQNNNISIDIVELMYYRFYKGLAWKKCAKVKGWSENKCFRNYKIVLCKLNK